MDTIPHSPLARLWNTLSRQGLGHTLAVIRAKALVRVLPAPKARPLSLLGRLARDDGEARRRAHMLTDDFVSRSCSLEGQWKILKGKDLSFAGREVVVLAHWDPQNVVDPYVACLARHFQSLGRAVVLASSDEPVNLNLRGTESGDGEGKAPADPAENATGATCGGAFSGDHGSARTACDVADAFDAIVCRTCSGYDFTSWKAALLALPSLFEAGELTLCNDSVFAPVGSYAPVYGEMAGVSCDFWGLTSCFERIPHLSSYHLVFREKALRHPAFRAFMQAVPTDSSYEAACACEHRLGLWLELNGLTPGCFRPFPVNAPIYLWASLPALGVPILKRRKVEHSHCPGWRELLAEYGYPVELADNYFRRTGTLPG